MRKGTGLAAGASGSPLARRGHDGVMAQGAEGAYFFTIAELLEPPSTGALEYTLTVVGTLNQ